MGGSLGEVSTECLHPAPRRFPEQRVIPQSPSYISRARVPHRARATQVSRRPNDEGALLRAGCHMPVLQWFSSRISLQLPRQASAYLLSARRANSSRTIILHLCHDRRRPSNSIQIPSGSLTNANSYRSSLNGFTSGRAPFATSSRKASATCGTRKAMWSNSSPRRYGV